MYRMPYRAMCSRETNRLPVAELQRKLGYLMPNIENGRAVSEEPADPKFFVYLGALWEFGIAQDGLRQGPHCALVEVVGLEERIIAQGDAFYSLSFRMGDQPYAKFEGRGEKIGLFSSSCTSPRAKW